MSVPFELRTERLHLVRITDAHRPDLLQLDSDPEVMRYITGGEPTTEADYDYPKYKAIFDQRYADWVAKGRPARQKSWWKFW